MKKSDIIYEAACMIADGEHDYICLAVEETRSSLETTFPIRRNIHEDIALLYKSANPDTLYVPNNFYTASPDDWWLTDEEFRTLRAMYCLFLYEDYLSQGD